jgi:hypothetical protein
LHARFGDPRYEERSNFVVRVDLGCPKQTFLGQYSVLKWFQQACNKIDAVHDDRVTGHRHEGDMRTLAKRRLFARFCLWQTFSQNLLYQLFKFTGKYLNLSIVLPVLGQYSFEKLRLYAHDQRYDREGAPARPQIHGVSDVGLPTGLAYQVFISKFFRVSFSY